MDLADAMHVLSFLFLGGPEPSCMEAANPVDVSGVDITDGIYILNWLFLGGSPLPSPGPFDSGPDPQDSPSDQGCHYYRSC